ncbi:MAG: hypothetical protein R3321_06070, partial [Nitrososphaeraceae archaeon]|nr:hypothetical protein [Nitrososphaeraceae archaeon]
MLRKKKYISFLVSLLLLIVIDISSFDNLVYGGDDDRNDKREKAKHDGDDDDDRNDKREKAKHDGDDDDDRNDKREKAKH